MSGGGKSAVIVGAGLVGSLLAIYQARRSWRVTVYERRPDPRAKGYAGGRSINLALSARGLWGLEGVGLDKHVLERDAIRMPGRMIHPPPSPTSKGELTFQPYSHDPKDAINSVSRGGLNITLLEAAAKEASVQLVFDQRCVQVDIDRGRAWFETVNADGSAGAKSEAEGDWIIGADGAFSAVRLAMQMTDRFDYSQTYLEHGYKELHIPARGGRHVMEQNALHIWPRGGSMMIALPNRDGSFTNTLFWPFDGQHSFANLKTREQVLAFFGEQYPDAPPLMPTLADDFLRNPVSSLVTVKCWPWVRFRRDGRAVMLIGDAAHAIVPFYGQGMNCGFEDCRVLGDCLDRRGADFGAAMEEYQAQRKPDADAIAEMAVENFVEMRDKVGQPEFLYRKRVEQAVHHAFPDRVTPQYNLVSFSTVPYAEARRRGRELDAVIDRIIRRLPRETAGMMPEAAWREKVAAAASEELRGGQGGLGAVR